MQIYGPAQVHAPHSISAPHAAGYAKPAAAPSSAAVSDELQISDVGAFLDLARNVPEIRQDRVQQIRAALAEGTYDVESRLNAAVDRLLDEIG